MTDSGRPATSPTPGCPTPGCPRLGMPASYSDRDEPQGGRCPACGELTNPLIVESPHRLQLGAGYGALVTVDGCGNPNGWAVYSPDGRHLTTVQRLDPAFAFVAGHLTGSGDNRPESNEL
jgi:hypothetical protein